MSKIISKAGNSGPKVRSDCEVTLELKNSGGLSIELESKVATLYGESIKLLVTDVIDHFGIRNASISIYDSGALPFVIAARTEAAIRQLVSTDKQYLPEFPSGYQYGTTKDRFRFSRLYLPGNTPGLMINAGLHSADGLILDLEDSVAPEKKEEARILVRNALRQIDFCGAERMVRINQGEMGISDLRYVIPHNVNMILIPKCESALTVYRVEEEISKLKSEHRLNNDVYLMPILESALGIENAFEIATSSSSVAAMAIGLEDFTADLGIQRTVEGTESLFARSRLVLAAKAAGIQPIDSVFSDVADMEGLQKTVFQSKAIGFEGMGCIHPRQVAVIKKGYLPQPEELEKAKKIVIAFNKARAEGLGVVAVGSKMIDAPVVARAQKLIDLAVSTGLMQDDQRDDISE
jgi:citrate lyase subunit beta / citryl-CoA lyase